ncbi:MAG: hypothetical protein PHZ09_01915 [Eubacteriales bacterium]|nr:hypothetical protein [Eubacteriales bacterium]
MIAVCIIALLIFVLSTRTNSSKHEPVYTEYTGAIISGILLTAAPVAPFFIIGNPWFSLRSAVCSFSGIALILDALIRFIFKNKNIAGIITASFVCICCVSSVSELHDYKATYEYDQLVAGIILDEINDKPNLGRTGILNLNASYLDEQNFYWHEHIHGVTENDWALFGALVSISAPFNGEIVPLATDGPAYYAAWNRDTKNIAGFDTIYFWDEKREELSLLLPQKINDAEYMLYHTNGDLCAHVWEDKDYGHIKVY